MFLVLVERGRADTVQFAARERRLEQVGGVHRAVGFSRADQRVHLVDEQHDAALRRGHLVEHGFQPFLEFAAIFRPGDQRAEIEREELLVLEAFRHVFVDDAQRQALDDRRLADAGLADQHRIVLGAPRQHLDGAADFLVAADHRIELAVAGRLGEIAGVFLQGVIGVFRRGAVGRATAAQRIDRRVEALRIDAGDLENLAGLAVLLQREREQQSLDGDKAVARLLAGLLGGVEHARQRGGQINLPGGAAADFGNFVERGLGRLQRLPRIAARAVDQPGGETFGIVQQHLEQMLRRELLMAFAQGQRLRGLDKTPRTVGVFLEIHRLYSFGPDGTGCTGSMSATRCVRCGNKGPRTEGVPPPHQEI